MSIRFEARNVIINPLLNNRIEVEAGLSSNHDVEGILDEIKEDFIVEYLESKGYTVTKEE